MKEYRQTTKNPIASAVLDALEHYGGEASLQTIKNWVHVVWRLEVSDNSVSSAVSKLVSNGYIKKISNSWYKINCKFISDANIRYIKKRKRDNVFDGVGQYGTSPLRIFIETLSSDDFLVDGEHCDDAITELHIYVRQLRESDMLNSNKKIWLEVLIKALDKCYIKYRSFI